MEWTGLERGRGSGDESCVERLVAVCGTMIGDGSIDERSIVERVAMLTVQELQLEDASELEVADENVAQQVPTEARVAEDATGAGGRELEVADENVAQQVLREARVAEDATGAGGRELDGQRNATEQRRGRYRSRRLEHGRGSAQSRPVSLEEALKQCYQEVVEEVEDAVFATEAA